MRKLNDLRVSLKDGAATALAHLPFTAANYGDGTKLLDQYFNKRLVLKAPLDAIFQATRPRSDHPED